MGNSITVQPMESVDVARCVVGFSINCKTLDRANDTFEPGAINTVNHQKNPIALFSHDRGLPIGVCENVEKQYTVAMNGDTLTGEIWFNQSDPMAMQVFDLVAKGIIRGVSTGFIPKKYQQNEAGGLTFQEVDLLEVSLCVIPENPDGLVAWVEKSIREPIELQERIAKHIYNHLPRERVMKLKLKSENKPNDPPPNPKPDDNKPDKPDESELTPGMKALTAYHDMMLAMSVKMDELARGHDSADVKEFMTARKETFASEADACKELYEKLYPDGPELKADAGAEHEIPVEEVKHLKQLERELKKMLDDNQRIDRELTALKTKGLASRN